MRFVRLLVGENNNGLGTLFWISRIKVREHRNETESCHYKNNEEEKKKKKITRKTAKTSESQIVVTQEIIPLKIYSILNLL